VDFMAEDIETLTSFAVGQSPSPIRIDSAGTVRVGETRVRLASVLHLHIEGSAPEEIREHFPSLTLAEIDGAIAYYLHNRSDVDSHLAEQEAEAERVRREIESRADTQNLRRKLRAGKSQAP